MVKENKPSTPGAINRETHQKMAEEADKKADAVKTVTSKDVEHKQDLRNLAREHRNVANTGNPEGKTDK